MTLEHVAIWTDNLERLKDFYCTYFDGLANKKYTNEKNQFQSYFLSFKSGARVEIMSRPDIPENANDRVILQHRGIIHLAFGVDTKQEVEDKAAQLKSKGFPILSGSRATGDGYYEFETLDPDNNRLEVTTKL
jgi:lactoylglutathione lyase